MPNLKKIFWLVFAFVLIVWIGVGIYYLKSTRSSQTPVVPPSEVTVFPTAQPTEPLVYESLEQTHFIVGHFQGWEEIEDSQDRYILLSNPATKRNYPKIRVVLELNNRYENYEFWVGITAFSVEKSEEKYDDLGYLKDFTAEEIDKLIKKGDNIKVVFEREAMIKKSEEDSEGTDDFLALSLSIKRTEGKIAVEQELGRQIQKL